MTAFPRNLDRTLAGSDCYLISVMWQVLASTFSGTFMVQETTDARRYSASAAAE